MSEERKCPYMLGKSCLGRECAAKWLIQVDEDGNLVFEGCSDRMFPQFELAMMGGMAEMNESLDAILYALNEEEVDEDTEDIDVNVDVSEENEEVEESQEGAGDATPEQKD